MGEFDGCKEWKKTNIIDLPYSPFIPDELEIRKNIINELAKHIRKIKNNSYRENILRKIIKNDRDFVFKQSDTLIGIDISAITGNAKTYLDNLMYILTMYPMVLVNSHIECEDVLKTSTLHSYCKEKYYILPAFGDIPFWDKAQSEDEYSDKITDLLKGVIENISISDLDQPCELIDKISIRFPQFQINSKIIKFKPQITWIGVQDLKIEKLLNDLFNQNIRCFSFKKKCKEYEIDKNVLRKYIDKSMLFYAKKNKDEVLFRIQRENIYWGFICNLAEQLEKEMIDRDAICYDVNVEKGRKKEKEVDEIIYHRLGNLFIKCDAFTYKIYSYIKKFFNNYNYLEIIVIDNGSMGNLIRFFKETELQRKIYEILDYYGVAVKIPTTNYDNLKDKNVLVITDVINTGNLIDSVIDLLNNIGCRFINIFSFVVNQNYTMKAINNSNITLRYLMEKKLSNVKHILEKEYTQRFQNDSDLNFKLLWGEIGKDILLNKNENDIVTYLEKNMNLLELRNYQFILNSEISKHTYIFQKLERILKNFELIVILKSIEAEYGFFYELLRKVKNEIRIVEILEGDIIFRKQNEKIKGMKNIIFFIPTSFLSANRDNVNKYFRKNQITDSYLFDFVGFQPYSLDTDFGLNIDKYRYKYIFQSKLKYFIGKEDNPIFNLLKEIK